MTDSSMKTMFILLGYFFIVSSLVSSFLRVMFKQINVNNEVLVEHDIVEHSLDEVSEGEGEGRRVRGEG